MFTSAMRLHSLAFVAATVACAGAQAQLFRAYLSASGSDANPCTLQAPCRLLPAALNAVADDGEIWMLDSANYNTASVNVTKSVSILAVPGTVGSLVALNDAPAVSIAASGLNVALRNVVIGQLAGAPQDGTYGVKMTGASKLTIESSLLVNLPFGGVQVIGTGTLKMINTTVRDSAGGAVYLLNGATAEISGSHMLQNSNGVRLFANSGTTTTASISDSFIGEAYYGAFSEAASGGTARIMMTRSSVADSYFALYCVGPGSSTIFVGSSMIANNQYAYWKDESCAAIYTAGNNQLNVNTYTYGTLTPLALR